MAATCNGILHPAMSDIRTDGKNPPQKNYTARGRSVFGILGAGGGFSLCGGGGAESARTFSNGNFFMKKGVWRSKIS